MNGRRFSATLIMVLMSVQVTLAEDEEPVPVRVGILHSQTGTMAVSEQSLVHAITMAIDEINQRGGVLGRPLQPIVEDGASDWSIFARKAEKLIVTDQVVSVFGCWTSASRKAVLPVFEKHDHLLWYPLQYEGQESSPNVIYTGAAPNQQITPAFEWCRREFGTRMFLVGSDYLFPRTANHILRLRLEDAGGTVVGEEYRRLGSQDFDDIAAKIKETRPDVVMNSINGDSNRAFFQALRRAGLDHRQAPVMSFSIAEDELRHIGVELAVGHFAAWNYFQSIDTPANRRFVRAFRKRYGADRVTDDPIEAAYFQVHLFAKAVEKAGSVDVRHIRRAARGLMFAAPGGLVRIDPRNQHTWKVSRIGRILANGQFRILWTSEDPLPPQPWLPVQFLATADEQGQVMFTSLSAMIDLEVEQPADADRKRLLGTIADVRGFLGNVRTRFRSACLMIQPGNRTDFERAWKEFEQRCDTLQHSQHQFTETQRDAFARFTTAREMFQGNAESMFRELYRRRKTASEVPK
ncbi:MAG: urea ABC transporter substrate-binding protein [Fuerstiella sp.]